VLYELVHGKSLSKDKIALINQTSLSNTGKSCKILRAMDIPVKAIVDLDFAFVAGPKSGFLSKKHPSIVACKKILQRLA